MLTHSLQSPTSPVRAVIIGGNGFVGGAVAANLRARGCQVVSIGRGEVDLLDPGAPATLARLLTEDDAIVFASARAPCRDIGMMVDNMVMVRAVVGALTDVKPAYLLNISSDAVYGDEPLPISERHAPAPTTMHGAMHLSREIALATAFADRMASLRPTLIYGASDPHNGYGPNRFRRLAAANDDIVLFGEGEERRDHVLVDDVAELAARAVLHRSTGILNAATGEVHSFRTAAELAVSIAGSRSVIRATQRNGPMPHNGYRPFDASATHAAFPDFKFTSLPDGMQKVAAQTGQESRRG